MIVRSLLAATVVAVALMAGCSGLPMPPAAQVRQVLAPTGPLRVGLYAGSPTSIIENPNGAKGVGFDLGKEMARRLGVPFAPVVFARNADVLAALKAGQVDVSLTNSSAERLKDLDFSPTVLDIEKGYLVRAGAGMETSADMDRPGIRIGVSQGSSTEGELANAFQHAVMVRVATLKDAIAMLASARLDVFATNKAILFEMSDQVPGSRVLDLRWGLEHIAFATPKGRDAGAAYLRQLVADLKSEGLVGQAVLRVGLRGTLDPESGGND